MYISSSSVLIRVRASSTRLPLGRISITSSAASRRREVVLASVFPFTVDHPLGFESGVLQQVVVVESGEGLTPAINPYSFSVSGPWKDSIRVVSRTMICTRSCSLNTRGFSGEKANRLVDSRAFVIGSPSSSSMAAPHGPFMDCAMNDIVGMGIGVTGMGMEATIGLVAIGESSVAAMGAIGGMSTMVVGIIMPFIGMVIIGVGTHHADVGQHGCLIDRGEGGVNPLVSMA